MTIWAYMRMYHKCMGTGNIAPRIREILRNLSENYPWRKITLYVLCPDEAYVQRKGREVYEILTGDGTRERFDELDGPAGLWIKSENILIQFVRYTEDKDIAFDPADEEVVYWFDSAFPEYFPTLERRTEQKKRKKSPVIYLYPRYTFAWMWQMSMVVVALAAATFAAMAWLWIWIFNMTR